MIKIMVLLHAAQGRDWQTPPKRICNNDQPPFTRWYEGGTTKAQVEAALNAKATIVFQEFCCEKTSKYIATKGQDVVALNAPVGVAGTDAFLMAISRLTGKPIPAELEKERGQLVDAMADSQSHLHGKRYALYGDPDQLIGYSQFLLELGAEPTHVLATNGTEDWAKKVQALLASSPYGAGCKAYPKRDLWHLRSLLHTEPVDFLIGNTYGKYLERDTGVPLIRLRGITKTYGQGQAAFSRGTAGAHLAELLLALGAPADLDAPGRYRLPAKLACDERGFVYVVDQFFHKVEVLRRVGDAEARELVAQAALAARR